MTGFLGFVVLIVATALVAARFLKAKKRVRGEHGTDTVKVPYLKTPWTVILSAYSVGLVLMLFNGMFFYANPAYIYHVRTIWGQELVVDGLGYKVKGFGEIEPWKKGITIMAQKGTNGNGEEIAISYSILPEGITFLDQVDATVTATLRVSMPTDETLFLNMAHDFRTQTNFLRTSVVPAFRTTIDATGSMMSAEDYYSGGKTSFQDLFLDQMANGIYIVKRYEKVVKLEEEAVTANASLDQQKKQGPGENKKTVFYVERIKDREGNDRRKVHNFLSFGVTVNDAMITNCKPNDKFLERMTLKQKASADRAIAKEQRIQEEEQRLLAIAKGEREVAETEAKWKADQKEKTTQAETEKQLAITAATKVKEEARISKETSEILLEKQKIDAEAITVRADAEAYEKEKLLMADNALDKKLEAMIQMNRDTAEAMARRQVPQTVIYSGDTEGGLLGSDGDVNSVIKTQLLKNVKALDLDMSIKAGDQK